MRAIPTFLRVSIAVAILTCCAASNIAQAVDPIVSRQVMVRLEAGFDIDDFNAQYRTTTLRSIPGRNIHLLELPPEEPDEDAWAEARNADPPPGWVWGEANYEGQSGEGRTGSFFVAGINGGVGYNNQYPRDQQSLPQAHQITTGGGVRVAVLDTGIDASHPLLVSNIGPGGFNFVNENTNTDDVAEGVDDDGDGLIDESAGHGTFVGGLLLMMAPDAEIVPIKVLNSDGVGDNFIIAQGIFHAIDNNVDVINISLGSTYKSQVVEDAVAEASIEGVVIVAAAGNRNLDGDEGPGNGNPAREWPALMSEVIGVTALDASDIKSPFSNYSDDVALSAPGSGGIFSSIPETDDGYRYAEWEGTSFATAIVSGAAALLVEANPHWSGAARDEFVAAALAESAVDVDDLNPQYERQLGDGRLDLIAALSTTPTELVITDLQVVTGQHVAGGLLEVGDSDDRHLQVRSSLGPTIAQPHVMELRIDALTLNRNPPALLIEIETRVDEPGARGHLFLRDWTTSDLVAVGDYAPTQTDRVFSFNIINPRRYISPSGEAEIRLRHVVVVPFFAFQFRSFFDEFDFDLD